jgi:predicted  nucleic acid-binding Zn-ribbon protein
VDQELTITLARLREAAELYRQRARARRDGAAGSDLAGLDAEYADDQRATERARQERAVAAARLEDELQSLENRLRDRRACRPADTATQQAIIRDVEAMRGRRDEIEKQLLALWQDHEVADRQDDRDDRDAAAARQKIATRQQAADRRRAQAELAVPEIESELAHLMKRLPPRVARQLERAGRRLDDPIADLVQGSCDSCGYAMPAQDAIDADREAALVTCQGCGRFVVPRSSRKTRNRE